MNCPLCGVPVTLGGRRTVIDAAAWIVVADPPGTFWPHLRAVHPDEFAVAVRRRERANGVLGKRLGALPRDVDGTLLEPGQRVGTKY